MLLVLHPCCQAQLVTQAWELRPDPQASTSLHLSGFTLPCLWASRGLPLPHPSRGCSLDLGARLTVSNLPSPPAGHWSFQCRDSGQGQLQAPPGGASPRTWSRPARDPEILWAEKLQPTAELVNTVSPAAVHKASIRRDSRTRKSLTGLLGGE